MAGQATGPPGHGSEPDGQKRSNVLIFMAPVEFLRSLETTSSAPAPDQPKRRGRPPKNPTQQPQPAPARTPATVAHRAAGSRASRRLAQSNGNSVSPDESGTVKKEITETEMSQSQSVSTPTTARMSTRRQTQNVAAVGLSPDSEANHIAYGDNNAIRTEVTVSIPYTAGATPDVMDDIQTTQPLENGNDVNTQEGATSTPDIETDGIGPVPATKKPLRRGRQVGKSKVSKGKVKAQLKRHVDPLVQGCRDRQAQLSKNFRSLARIIKENEVHLLDQQLEALLSSPDNFKSYPGYGEVRKALDWHLKENLRKRATRRAYLEASYKLEYDAGIELANNEFYIQVKEAKEGHVRRGQLAAIGLVQKARDEVEDPDLTDDEEPVLDPHVVEAVVNYEPPVEQLAPIVEAKKTRGKRKADDAPPAPPRPKRRSAMGDAEILPEVDDEESAKPKTKYDQYGLHYPNTQLKFMVDPWFDFDKEEIGLRSTEAEASGKPPLRRQALFYEKCGGLTQCPYKNFDHIQFYGGYDHEVIECYGLHPVYGVPIMGSRNPDNVYPRTNYEAAIKHVPEPLRLKRNENDAVGVPTSRTWDLLTAPRKWSDLARHMKLGQGLRSTYGREDFAALDSETHAKRKLSELLEAVEYVDAQDSANQLQNSRESSRERPSKRRKLSADDDAQQPNGQHLRRSTRNRTAVSKDTKVPASSKSTHSKEPRAEGGRSTGNLHHEAFDPLMALANAAMEREVEPPRPSMSRRSAKQSIDFINNPETEQSGFVPIAPQPMPALQHPPPPQHSHFVTVPGVWQEPAPLQDFPPPPRRVAPTTYASLQPHPPQTFYGPAPAQVSKSFRSIMPRTEPRGDPAVSQMMQPVQPYPQQVQYHSHGYRPPPQQLFPQHQLQQPVPPAFYSPEQRVYHQSLQQPPHQAPPRHYASHLPPNMGAPYPPPHQ